MIRPALGAMLALLLWVMPAHAHYASTFVASPRQTYNLDHGWRTTTGDPGGEEYPDFDDPK